MLGAEKRTRTNDSELRWRTVCYPLRGQKKGAFKQARHSG